MPQEHNYYTITEADDIIIDEKFKRILPVRAESELVSLEHSILKYGCIEPLILWKNILLDGHNRLEILKKNEIPVKTVSTIKSLTPKENSKPDVSKAKATIRAYIDSLEDIYENIDG